MDAFPLAKGHSLVIPKTHYEKIQDISKEDNSDLFETVRKVISKVDKITDATLLAIHNGKQSGQEIPHVHVHLIPRSSEDSAGPVHSMFSNSPKLTDKEVQDLYEKLKEFSVEIDTTKGKHIEVLKEIGESTKQELLKVQEGLGLDALAALIANLEEFEKLSGEVLNQDTVNLLLSEAISSVKSMKNVSQNKV